VVVKAAACLACGALYALPTLGEMRRSPNSERALGSTPGTLSLCVKCGHIGVMTPDSLRRLTSEEACRLGTPEFLEKYENWVAKDVGWG
jgi:hypothetical protein